MSEWLDLNPQEISPTPSHDVKGSIHPFPHQNHLFVKNSIACDGDHCDSQEESAAAQMICLQAYDAACAALDVLGRSFQLAAQRRAKKLSRAQDKLQLVSKSAAAFVIKSTRTVPSSRVMYEHKSNVESRLRRSSTVFNKKSYADGNVSVGRYYPSQKPDDHLPLQKRHIAWGCNWALDDSSSFPCDDRSSSSDTDGVVSRLLSPAIDTAFGGSLFGNITQAASPTLHEKNLHISLKERFTRTIKVRSPLVDTLASEWYHLSEHLIHST